MNDKYIAADVSALPPSVDSLASLPRRRWLAGSGAAMAAMGLAGGRAVAAQAPGTAEQLAPEGYQDSGRSPWGYDTWREATPAPPNVRPGEQSLPARPRAYTDVKSYHAHIYFDEDNHAKAALLRQWVIERFEVELGDWNLEPRGPHVTPSFYFGFMPEQLAQIYPWLQLNSLGLTILIHPNTDDPRSDHLYYAGWINRSQPVNAYNWAKGKVVELQVEKIYPNIKPSKRLET